MVNNDDNEPHADVVLMGGAEVGKTAILHRMLHLHNSPTLSGKYNPTIEDSFIREFIVGDQRCRLRLIDTAGGYAFPAMQRLWVRRASAFVLVCARNDPLSLEHLRNIWNQMREERLEEIHKLIRVLVINKCDLPKEDWHVQDADVELIADEMAISYKAIVCTSALLNTSIVQIFQMLWQQNEEAGPNAIRFEPDTDKSIISRRSSAFAVLFGSSSAQKRNSATQLNPLGRPHAGSFSEALVRKRQPHRFIHSSNGSAAWLAKTFTKLHVGQRARTNLRPNEQEPVPNVIDMNCNIS